VCTAIPTRRVHPSRRLATEPRARSPAALAHVRKPSKIRHAVWITLTCAGWLCIMDAGTSLREASTRIQATDPERRETPRVRTALPGLRVGPKWLPDLLDTSCGAKALTSGVQFSTVVGSVLLECAYELCGCPRMSSSRGGEGRMSSSSSPGRYPGFVSSRSGLRHGVFS
jgi:hypothetical protein